MFKTATCYVQQSPWLGIIHKQLELIGRYMAELGMPPAARSRVQVAQAPLAPPQPITIRLAGPRDWPPRADDEVVRQEPDS